MFALVAKYRTIWPGAWLCDALGVPRTARVRARRNEELCGKVKASLARNAEGDPEILEGDPLCRGEVQLAPCRQKSLCRHIDQVQPVSVLPLEW